MCPGDFYNSLEMGERFYEPLAHAWFDPLPGGLTMDARTLSEHGGISGRDASLLLAIVPLYEIYDALRLGTVPDMRDRILRDLKDSLNERYP